MNLIYLALASSIFLGAKASESNNVATPKRDGKGMSKTLQWIQKMK